MFHAQDRQFYLQMLSFKYTIDNRGLNERTINSEVDILNGIKIVKVISETRNDVIFFSAAVERLSFLYMGEFTSKCTILQLDRSFI